VSESIFSGADHRLRCHWLRANWSNRIWAKEQVTEGAPQQVGDPPARKMVGAVVDQMAALTKASQVTPPIVGRIVIEVRRSQNYLGVTDLCRFDKVGPAGQSAATIAPGALGGVVPATVG
jgi:hypothetical protein